MKKNVFIITCCLLATMSSCDYISNPLQPVDDNNGEACPTVAFPVNKPHRKILVEDYTGHKCPNCPKAAVTAEQLKDKFGDSVVVVAIHVDFFAWPDANFPEEFRTKAGDDFQTKTGADDYKTRFKLNSYPVGLINRKDYPTTHKKSFGSWAGEVNTLLRTPVEADIQLRSDYNSADSNTCITVQSKLLTPPSPGTTYKLCVMLIQDSIIAPQIDGSVTKKDYVHRHMLRDNINGTWGETLITENIPQGTPIINKYRYKIKHDYSGIVCKPKDCHLVAFIFDDSNYRILQAEEIKVIH